MGKGKNIALVTWYKGANYGSLLQAWATVRVLEDLGHNVHVIKYFRDSFGALDVLKNALSSWGVTGFLRDKRHPWRKKVRKFRTLVREEISLKAIITERDKARLFRETDLFMAGSDQLWNCNHHFRGFEFLDFAGNGKRISYATSMGGGSIPEGLKASVKEYLDKFASISLREKSGADAVAALTGRNDIAAVLDPVLLLDAERWREMGVPFLSGEPYILCYLLKEDDYSARIERIKAESGISRVIVLPSNENPMLRLEGGEILSDAGPREFIGAMAGAAYVCTDSFHGCVFAILMSRKFAAFRRFDDGPASQNGRLSELFGLLGTGDRFFRDAPLPEIDYEAVGKRLETLRAGSLAWLEEAIG